MAVLGIFRGHACKTLRAESFNPLLVAYQCCKSTPPAIRKKVCDAHWMLVSNDGRALPAGHHRLLRCLAAFCGNRSGGSRESVLYLQGAGRLARGLASRRKMFFKCSLSFKALR